ncbi:MAG: tetrahydromethanopterin S-methyltransferase subunit H, partial [Candidatus Bathyarchaeota archaeon]|nr:tetrahydromethanopterin S-methyltransferase subunit H [Candidatus Bathyarchaeota archaeon]
IKDDILDVIGDLNVMGKKSGNDAANGKSTYVTLYGLQKAEELLKKQEEMSDLTGNPCMVQVFSESEESITKYIDFVANVTDAPFLIDSTDAKVRIAGAKFVKETGLVSRAVYNSINPSIDQKELDALKSSGITNSIILAFNVKDPSVKGRVELLLNGAGLTPKGLLEIADECGVVGKLVDVAIVPLGSGAGSALMSTYVIKSKFGLPVGSGIHNAVSAWTWLKKVKKSLPFGKEMFKFCDLSSNLLQIMSGGNFVLYGPIENAEGVFAIAAMADVFIAEAASLELKIVPSEGHPFKRLVS